jgi:hypothetical protein
MDPDPIRIQGFNDQKWKKYSKKKKKNFLIKNYNWYLFLGLRKEHPSYRRSLLSIEAIQLQNMNFYTIFLFLWVIFALLDPDSESGSGSTDPMNPDPIRIRIHNPAHFISFRRTVVHAGRIFIDKRMIL